VIHRSSILILIAAVAALVVLPQGASAQAQAKKGTVEKITVHGDALVGNLAGEPADRTVFVYLPPSYATERNRRYPVAYLLHGYGLTGERWMTFAHGDGWTVGIHGTPQPQLLGQAVSGGCIRMRNADVIRVYDRVHLGTTVIVEP